MHTFAQKPKAPQQATPAKSPISGRAHLGHSQEVNSTLHLQRTIGNQAVQRLLQANAEETRFAHDFSRIPVHSSALGGIQPKLMVNTPGDIYEQEADRIADQVMTTPAPHAVSSVPSRIQRLSEQSNRQIDAAPASVNQALASFGRPLEPALRQDMEPRFGHDFSQVRVHSDPTAERSAQEVNAHAYTVGRDIVFGAGRFVPETQEGRRLIAHELTHVLQQSGSQHPTVVAREKNSPSKEEIEKSEKQRKASALFWNDLKTYFPGEGRKLAGSGYDDTVDYLTTSFQEGETMEGGVKIAHSAPTVYVGKKYLSEQDIDKRKAAIKAELEKIDKFRFDNARIDNDDLNNTVITGKIGSLDISGKRDYLQRLEAQTFIKNVKVKEYIRRSMPSTPLQAGAVATTAGGFELQFENIKIVVQADVFNSTAVAANEAHTEIQRIDSETYKTKPGFNWGKDQKVSSMTFTPSVPQLIYKVEIHYGPQSDPSYTSGYGVGTRPEDTAGNTSVRFHEGMHGTVFIQFIKDNIAKHSFPVFDGKIGDNKNDFGRKVEAYEKKVLAFDQMLKDAVNASEQQVDCVGKKTIEQFHTEKGTTSKVKCKVP